MNYEQQSGHFVWMHSLTLFITLRNAIYKGTSVVSRLTVRREDFFVLLTLANHKGMQITRRIDCTHNRGHDSDLHFLLSN